MDSVPYPVTASEAFMVATHVFPRLPRESIELLRHVCLTGGMSGNSPESNIYAIFAIAAMADMEQEGNKLEFSPDVVVEFCARHYVRVPRKGQHDSLICFLHRVRAKHTYQNCAELAFLLMWCEHDLAKRPLAENLQEGDSLEVSGSEVVAVGIG